ncbi:MAG: hydrogenase nickel incorporation protein HypB [Saprospiraceae bacterium]|nr:hydrogenase nickel incorporation protein HypB [Saprospiraceae bacterium]
MCSTCGCGHADMITITKIGDEENHEHFSLHAEEAVSHAHHHHHHESGQAHTHRHVHEDGTVAHHHHEVPTSRIVVDLEMDILHKNDLMASRNRGYFEALQIVALNLVSSPGSGKTSLLETTLTALSSEVNCHVIEGDQQSSNDAQRIAETQVPVVQINTGKACHLDAQMVQKAYKQLSPENRSILFIENVGNLVCPAMFDLGESARVVIISVTEGDDKPIKYPDMFHSADICVINKIDLLPYVQFDVDKVKEYALRVNPNLEFFELSATTGEGMESWYKWLHDRLRDAP